MRLTPVATKELTAPVWGLPPLPDDAAGAWLPEAPPAHDPVDHPSHYTSHPSGVEAITITEHFSFNLGNAVKYIWRAGLKNDDPFEDLEKAAWYVHREIDRLTVLLRLGDFTNEDNGHVHEEAP